MAEEVSAGAKRRARKTKYKAKFERLLKQYTNILIVGVDNVGSLQMQKVRMALRGRAELMMGKNTLMRMIVREHMAANPKLESLLGYIKGNVGLVFTGDDLAKVRNTIVEFKVPASAKSGVVAPNDVFVPAGPTGLDPGQTGFFQALNIATKIVKGCIEINSQVHLVRKGDKVSSSAVALLSKLDIKPFFYGMVALAVYEDGSTYPTSVLDITQEEILKKFMSNVAQLSAMSLGLNWPSELTLGYSMASSFRKLLAISMATDYKFAEAEALQKNAAAAAAAPPVAAAAAVAAPAEKKDDKKKGGKKEEKKVEEEEEDGVAVGGIFGMGGDD
jgi:large subunit ribosomal protein LP0